MKEFPLFLTPYFTISPLEVYVLRDQCGLLLRRRHEAPHFDKFHLLVWNQEGELAERLRNLVDPFQYCLSSGHFPP